MGSARGAPLVPLAVAGRTQGWGFFGVRVDGGAEEWVYASNRGTRGGECWSECWDRKRELIRSENEEIRVGRGDGGVGSKASASGPSGLEIFRVLIFFWWDWFDRNIICGPKAL